MKSVVPIILAFLLCACAVAPPQASAVPKPTAFILIGDCTAPAFAIAVDEHGHTAVMGGDAPPPSLADQALLAAAGNDESLHRLSIRIGDCQDD